MTLVLDGQYRLVRPAGSGGTAEVYLAESTATGEKVAVKVLKRALAADPDMLGRFRREAAVMARVKHPHVVRLVQFVERPEGLYTVMEWAPGTRLDVLVQRQPLVADEVQAVVLQVASALAAIHLEGIVHRDLKPENIIVERKLDSLHARVLDLGIARFANPDDNPGEYVSQAGQVAGTPAFVSPEQGRGEALDFQSDVYSFGVLAFWLLARRLPFAHENPYEVVRAHLETPPPPLEPFHERFRPWVPVVMQCLGKAREDRPRGAEAVLAALQGKGPARRRWWPFG